MPRPVESVLMQTLGLNYNQARQLANSARERLAIPKTCTWSRALEAECRRQHEEAEKGVSDPTISSHHCSNVERSKTAAQDPCIMEKKQADQEDASTSATTITTVASSVPYSPSCPTQRKTYSPSYLLCQDLDGNEEEEEEDAAESADLDSVVSSSSDQDQKCLNILLSPSAPPNVQVKSLANTRESNDDQQSEADSIVSTQSASALERKSVTFSSSCYASETVMQNISNLAISVESDQQSYHGSLGMDSKIIPTVGMPFMDASTGSLHSPKASCAPKCPQRQMSRANAAPSGLSKLELWLETKGTGKLRRTDDCSISRGKKVCNKLQ